MTEHKSSSVVHQNQFLARAVISRRLSEPEPSKTIETATEQSASIAMALAGAGLPAFCLFVAGLYRRHEDEAPPQSISPHISSAQQQTNFPSTVPRHAKTLRALAA